MMLKLAYLSRMLKYTDILKVPIEEFLEALSDLLCNPLYFPISKGF